MAVLLIGLYLAFLVYQVKQQYKISLDNDKFCGCGRIRKQNEACACSKNRRN